MIIIPAVDIKSGKSVRLKQGKLDAQTVHSNNPIETAKLWQQKGAKRIHVVDLDGAFSGTNSNINIIEQICKTVTVPVEVGGGIRTLKKIEELLKIGASYVVLGTIAIYNPQIVKEAVKEFGTKKIIVALDAKNGMVAAKGWEDVTAISILKMVENLKEIGIEEILYTDISRDGMLTGPDFNGLKELAKSGLRIIASGGVKTVEDILKLKEYEADGVFATIVGSALYTKDFDLQQAIKIVEQGE